MTVRRLTTAWIFLLILSAATALLADGRAMAGAAFVAAILALSGLKARVILLDYLGLRAAPGFRGGFTAFLVAFLSLAFALYALG